jgi:phospholipase C
MQRITGRVLFVFLLAGCSADPSPPQPIDPDSIAPEWSAESVSDETHSTHLWIVDRAHDLLNARGAADPAAHGAVTWLDRADCAPSWRQGLVDADYKAAYNDGRKDLSIGAGTFQIFLAGSTWASHFYDPDTGLNYKGQTSPTARTRIHDQLASFRAAQKRGDVGSACYALGLALHYLTDLTQPMHAANYTATDWPLELHTHFEEYAMLHQGQHLATTFNPAGLDPESLAVQVAHDSKSMWQPTKDAIAAAYGARCSNFNSYYKDHTECWQSDPNVDAWIAAALEDAQRETSQFLYALDLR